MPVPAWMAAASSGRACAAALVVLPVAAVALALVSQFQFDMQPCPWCVLQRVVFVVIALAALPALLFAHPAARRASAALVLPLSGAGMAAALWQHFVAAQTESCALTWADRFIRNLQLDQLWPAGFTPTASCAEGAVRLLGLPYEFWSLGLFLVLELLALRLLLARTGR